MVEFEEEGIITGCSGQVSVPLNPDVYIVQDVDEDFDLDPEDAANMTEFLLGIQTSPFVVVEENSKILSVLAPYYNDADGNRNEVLAIVPETICHTSNDLDRAYPNKELQNYPCGDVCNLVAQSFLFWTPTLILPFQIMEVVVWICGYCWR